MVGKGVIYTARLGHPRLPICDYYMLITRYLKRDGRLASIPHPEMFTHEPTLSPSVELFKEVQLAQELRSFDDDFFTTVFAPRFLAELKKEPAKSSLVDLKAILDSKKSVCLLCYCYKPWLCHRSLVAAEMKFEGYEVFEWGENSV